MKNMYKKTMYIGEQKITYLQSIPNLNLFNRKQPCILFLHPFALDSTIWQYQWDYFQDKYLLIAPDLPGFGGSLSKSNVTLEPKYYQTIITAFIQKNKLKKIIVVGNSLGGAVALSVLVSLSNIIHGAILIAPLSRSALDFGVLKRLAILFTKMPKVFNASQMIAPWMPIKNMLRLFFSLSFEKSFKALETINFKEKLISFYENQIALDNFFSVSRNLTKWSMLNTILPEIYIPVSLIWGEKDRVLPIQSGYELHSKLSNSTFTTIPDIGHLPQVESPKFVNEAILSLIKKIHF